MSLSDFERERLLTDVLMYEGQQHWLHYRHIEQERNQFLGYYFTLLVAIIGFFVAVGAQMTNWPDVAIGVASMAWVLGMVSLLILVSVRKFGMALRAYDRDIARIRASLFALTDGERTHLAADRGTIEVGVRHPTLHRVLDPQFTAEAIVGTSAVVAFGAQVVVAAGTMLSDDFTTVQRAFSCGLAVASVAGAGVAGRLWVQRGVARRRKEPSVPPARSDRGGPVHAGGAESGDGQASAGRR
ncbi:hypothetical protein [Dactylosporangium sp. NPDC000521]|uniref:hypothetical protein n=1 Tax=Dactylosporangium sp. NPDC000521 TaxID=3363975 RepID=UPI003678127D